jgi:hypothetical protein
LNKSKLCNKVLVLLASLRVSGKPVANPAEGIPTLAESKLSIYTSRAVTSAGTSLRQELCMQAESFTKAQFEEHALPARFAAMNVRPWREAGLEKGEFVYLIWLGLDTHAIIEVRSSILANGLSNPDPSSIRASLVNPKRKSLGMSVKRWVQRTVGWQERTLNVLRKLALLGGCIQPCLQCGAACKLNRSAKDKPNTSFCNLARYFLTCPRCRIYCRWLPLREPLPTPVRAQIKNEKARPAYVPEHGIFGLTAPRQAASAYAGGTVKPVQRELFS